MKFAQLSVIFMAWTKVNKIELNSTVFPIHFNNIFLKSLGLLHNLMRNWEILLKLMKSHKTNGNLILCFHSVANAMYFVDIQFCFLVLSKVDRKILVSFYQIWNFEVSNLAIVKVKKVNSAVTNAIAWLSPPLVMEKARFRTTDTGRKMVMASCLESPKLKG